MRCRMTKKILMISSLVLALMMLVGCGESEQPEQPATDPEPAPDPTPAPSEPVVDDAEVQAAVEEIAPSDELDADLEELDTLEEDLGLDELDDLEAALGDI